MKEVKNDNLKTLGNLDGKVVLLEFYSDSCPGCVKLEHVLKEIKPKLNGTAVIARANVEHNTKLINEYKVRACPTLVFMKDGEVLDLLTGSVSERSILSVMKEIK